MGNTKQSLVWIAPPSMPILPGATLPPSMPGATVWSTLALAMLVWTGEAWQYPVPPATQASKELQLVSLASSRALASDDAFKYIRSTATSDIQLVIPADAALYFDIGTYITGIQGGDGGIAFVPANGVTLNAASSFVTSDYIATRTKFAGFNLIKVGANEWDLTGDLTNIA